MPGPVQSWTSSNKLCRPQLQRPQFPRRGNVRHRVHHQRALRRPRRTRRAALARSSISRKQELPWLRQRGGQTCKLQEALARRACSSQGVAVDHCLQVLWPKALPLLQLLFGMPVLVISANRSMRVSSVGKETPPSQADVDEPGLLPATNDEGPRQRWQLALEVASSKANQQGQGATVARDCICPSERESEYCPVHLLWAHSLFRKERLRTTGVVNDNAPLFIDEAGHRITEARIQAAVERVAAAAGEPLEAHGAQRFGTHSLRVTRALWAFQAGVSEETVRALGRWSSTSAMLIYLRDTPLVRAAEASAAMAASIEAGHTGDLMSTNFRPVIKMEDARPEPDTDG